MTEKLLPNQGGLPAAVSRDELERLYPKELAAIEAVLLKAIKDASPYGLAELELRSLFLAQDILVQVLDRFHPPD